MVKLTLKRSSSISDFKGWAVMEWECCIKNQEDGAREGAEFIKIIL
jgi:hypothetical protein